MEAATATVEDGIFDATAYDLPIPSSDGHKAERLVVSFGGSIELDRTSEQDLEFVNGLKLGQKLSLTVTATVTKKGFTLNLGKDEEPDKAAFGVGFKVHSIG